MRRWRRCSPRRPAAGRVWNVRINVKALRDEGAGTRRARVPRRMLDECQALAAEAHEQARLAERQAERCVEQTSDG